MMFLKSDGANILIVMQFQIITANIDNFEYPCYLADC
jgi:hypothetical protein